MPRAGIYYSIMPAITLKAHYDGKTILLDEPFDIPENCDLMVTVLNESGEQADYSRLSSFGLASKFGDNEPDYNLSDIR